jgi:LEA14-like dessication related protein
MVENSLHAYPLIIAESTIEKYGKMKQFKTYILILIILVPFISSCGGFENIKIGEPESLEVKGFEGNYLNVNVRVPIDNPTSHRVKIQEIDMKVFLNGRYIGKLYVDEDVIIKAGKNKMYDLAVKVRMANILNTAFIMMSLKEGQQVPVRFEGKIVAKSMLMQRTLDINEERMVKI